MDEKIKKVPLRIEVEVPIDIMKCVEKKLKQDKKTLEAMVTDAIRQYAKHEYIWFLKEKGLTVDEISDIVGVTRCCVHISLEWSKLRKLPPEVREKLLGFPKKQRR